MKVKTVYSMKVKTVVPELKIVIRLGFSTVFSRVGEPLLFFTYESHENPTCCDFMTTYLGEPPKPRAPCLPIW